MSDALIRVEGLYKVFGKDPASVMPLVHEGRSKDDILAETGHTLGLKSIDLEIAKGEIYVIMGLSGSGKSTLIRHFNRLIDPTEGRILVEGTDVMQLSPRQLIDFRRHKMSMVFQRFGLLPHRSVLDNVAYGLAIQGVDRSSRAQQAQQWLEAVGLSGYGEQYPAQLSGGQQQRVGLARALCTNAEILLMDEAFSALDPLIRSEMQDQLLALQQKLHKTIIFITHDLDEALRLGDRIAILKDGALVQEGTPVDILLHPADDYVAAFVKDVNRARALTVETVMTPAQCCIEGDSVQAALKALEQAGREYGFQVAGRQYRGTLSRRSLEQAPGDHIDASLLETVATVAPNALIESVIPDTLETPGPLPVVSEDGNLCGELSRASLVEVLGDGSRRSAA
ncbi:ABC transporter ATP-binding protein [Marinobacterium nitratireducens]|uniref:Quaternary amine transport ATP-binding protein n=1 Tax=Marinobacterium nitratireducens TaxID=518897 RepID=A0A917ZPV7_9GAMM|nr:glycine betaine/L-proline ABC transporter ATP-binding protein [Marinobacterium nitratireducens]GGO88468.1 ABC transporter ATP-binding protein [Marinobacterium nitratireducens]